MRSLLFGFAILTLSLGAPNSSHACCDDTIPTTIKVPLRVEHCVVRGDILLCGTSKDRILAVDIKRGKSFDLGSSSDVRWYDGDVLDGQALVATKDRLRAISIENGLTAHSVPMDRQKVRAFGFAGKGRAFVYRDETVTILDLASGKTLHTVELGLKDNGRLIVPWQRIGNRLFIAGPSTTLCVVDLEAGKLLDRHSIDSRAGIQSLHVEGSQVYCIGYPVGVWAARITHIACYDMEMRKIRYIELPRELRHHAHLAGGPYGTVYCIGERRVERFSMAGDHCGTFVPPDNAQVMAIWQQHAIAAGSNEIRLIEIKETPVARK